VFITCCGEDDEVVLDTVRGACDQDYPRDQMRIISFLQSHHSPAVVHEGGNRNSDFNGHKHPSSSI
jgi:cellulose synthase/poly-beta-1,6-N-acetylglucosamine synthase-like glycosyltransferase